MKITTYAELQSKDELLPMFEHAFWWPYNPKEFEKTIKWDPRLKNSPVGYIATKNNDIVGFVGVMDIATRILDGSVERIGGIWGVVTHPVHARSGIFTALMQRSHEYFKEEGYRFALLNTSKSLIAHVFYQKLGYRDAVVYRSAYKLIKEPKKPVKKSGKKVKLDWDRILEIYSQTRQNHTGFVVRSKHYGKMLEIRKRIQPDKSIVAGKGYALLKESEGDVVVQEIAALTKENVDKLIIQIERKATKTVIDKAVLDKNVQKAYQYHGYMILNDSYDVLMSKQLTNATFKEVYGNRFYASGADFF